MRNLSTPIVPTALTSTWQTQMNQTYGIYDQDTVGNPDMSPSVLTTTMVNAMPAVTEFIWNYSEGLDWLVPGGGTTSTWQPAVWSARTQLGLPAP
jgi:hypothetical protein